MKERILGMGCIIGFLLFVGLVGGWESTYTRETTCINYLESEQVYQFMDDGGHVWEWEKDNRYKIEVGKDYKLIMDDNHTINNIYDDWIKKIKEI